MANARDLLPNAVLDHLKRGNKMEAIKLLRELSGLNLREAKMLVEANTRSPRASVDPATRVIGLLATSLANAAMKGKGQEAIKALQERAGAARAHAKVAAAKYHIETPRSRPGLSPGEVPRAGGAGGWAVLLIVGLVVCFLIVGGQPS